MAAGNAYEDFIVDALQEAQRDLEAGHTLPRFLVKEDQTLALNAGTHTVALPADFIREDDDALPHFTQAPDSRVNFIERKYYTDALKANLVTPSQVTTFPKVYVIRQSVIDFITTADKNYTILWNYYAKDQILSSNIQNLWLLNAPEWLLGEAGMRLAMDKRDWKAGIGQGQDAVTLFQQIRDAGQRAALGRDYLLESAGGSISMGANL